MQWLVAEGDTVTLNQTIAEVETAKAVVELPSPYAGVVNALHAAAGDVVEVGSVLISFDVAGQEAEAPAARANRPRSPTAEQNAPEEKAQPNLVGYGAAPRGSGRPQRRARSGRPDRRSASDTAVLEAAPHDVIHTHEPIEALRRAAALDAAGAPARASSSASTSRWSRRPVPTGLITRADVESYAARVGALRQRAGARAERPRASRRRRSAPPASRSAVSASTPPRRWCAAPSPPRT